MTKFVYTWACSWFAWPWFSSLFVSWFLSPAPFEYCSLLESHLKEYALEIVLQNKYSPAYQEFLRSDKDAKVSVFHQTGWDFPAGCWTSSPSTSGEAGLAALLAWPCSVAGVQPCWGEHGGVFFGWGPFPSNLGNKSSRKPLPAAAWCELKVLLPRLSLAVCSDTCFLLHITKVWKHMDKIQTWWV